MQRIYGRTLPRSELAAHVRWAGCGALLKVLALLQPGLSSQEDLCSQSFQVHINLLLGKP